ncbi:fluoride efflux transporter FluC [Haloactinospora alba]|uniref:fluoride efflux transporter FluC n=1 Tax=Haloactinospora alba TaxID=405555 RepID=UPI00114FBD2B|nr:CrcB family protein [Haloactinospora alba]
MRNRRNPYPVDPDLDAHVPRQRRELSGAPWAVLGVVAAGGALGALARYGAGLAVPRVAGGEVQATLAVNVSGCLLIGALMVVVTEARAGGRLLRPFLGTGVAGGYTTFSAHVGQFRELLQSGAAAPALAYLAGTLFLALAAVWLGVAVTRRVLRVRIAGEREVRQ